LTVLGPERPLPLSAADRERVAYHEGGHAILGLVVPGADPVNLASGKLPIEDGAAPAAARTA
jgi:ATP-dependent Zn protease